MQRENGACVPPPNFLSCLDKNVVDYNWGEIRQVETERN